MSALPSTAATGIRRPGTTSLSADSRPAKPVCKPQRGPPGSARGGVLAPNHAPFALAEQFATLAALNPDRIDMGIGRGPGTFDESALRRGAEPGTGEVYAQGPAKSSDDAE